MHLDDQTQCDLELFQSPVTGQSIFDTLDQTKTLDGKRALKKRFSNPLSEVSDIRQVQEIVKFLATHASQEMFPFSQVDLDAVDRYLNANFHTIEPAQNIVERVKEEWLSVRNPEFTHFVTREPWALLDFLKKARAFFDRFPSDTLPDQLREDVCLLRAIFGSAVVTEALQIPSEAGLSFHNSLKLDWHFRKELKMELLRLFDRLVDLDAFLSMAKAFRKHSLVFPEFVNRTTPLVLIHGVFHPFVDTPVLNDFKLDEEKNLLFLTGPNMAGKTTYLKAVCVAVLLAHVGMGVPATEMRLTPFSHIFFTLQAVDNIREGVSSFFSEVRRVKMVVEAMRQNGRVFAVFDELFKGTNVKDALDCSCAVINGLATCTGNLFLVSSHLLELHELVSARKSIDCHHFHGKIIEGKIWFDYRLKPGVNDQRLGFRILQETGLIRLLEETGSNGLTSVLIPVS